ncbi:HHL025Cp [Eremothecium sinecaudum]|uniref:HHL025Cp n=1 Tax=Eremothecium sinecaudum TaxID=45286 RepID=A0A0X8HWK5_9SACH|nr:HHL025Cp [Eremothecium sinecaudum]AMD22745.1 HHL025Cp [Eremothecium sinecaudum]
MSVSLNIAVQGCAHGMLNEIYKSLESLSEKPDLLLVLGDFQSLRSPEDYPSISIPRKYIKLGDFPDYYSGKRVAPVLTIFIGGNHENFAQLVNLPYGGWVSENIYYMGYSSVLWYRGVCIGGLSGIYKHWDVLAPPRPTSSTDISNRWPEFVRSLYHVRVSDVLPLLLLQNTKPQVMMSHDWPRSIENYGNCKELLRYKPHFAEDIKKGNLGSPLSWTLLTQLQPAWWLSAHLHVRFTANVNHAVGSKSPIINDDELLLDLADSGGEEEIDSQTNFLALDKCKRGKRTHLEMIEVPINSEHPTSHDNSLYWDPEFVAILRFLENDPEAQRAKNQKLSKTDLEALARRILLPNVTDWQSYRIPEATTDVIQSPTIQTEHIVKTFLYSGDFK